MERLFFQIWDLRQPNQLESSVPTRDKVLSIAWNPHEPSWLATGGIGGHDRTIRVSDYSSFSKRLLPLNRFGILKKMAIDKAHSLLCIPLVK